MNTTAGGLAYNPGQASPGLSQVTAKRVRGMVRVLRGRKWSAVNFVRCLSACTAPNAEHEDRYMLFLGRLLSIRRYLERHHETSDVTSTL